jgi:hypothetical protein
MDDAALVAYRARLHAAARALGQEHVARRRRRIVFVAVAAAMMLVATTTLAATGMLAAWLGGEPAPSEVKEDFAGIRPELGATPNAGAASEVARDEQIAVYATPTREGGYCIVAEVPWLRFDGDGRGYCVKPAAARRPLVAGIIGAASDESGSETYVVAGRARVRGAATVAFADPDGDYVERRVGSGGFFVAVISARIETCFTGQAWSPALAVADGEGRQLVRARFPFWIPGRDARAKPLRGTCGTPGPMSDEEAARILRER